MSEIRVMQPGDVVSYGVRGGWGGGETVRLLARVVKVHDKMVTIELIDKSHNRLVEKRVSIKSLKPSDPAKFDRELQYITECRERYEGVRGDDFEFGWNNRLHVGASHEMTKVQRRALRRNAQRGAA
jgi:hypothetical protein